MLRSALFSDLTQRKIVVSYRRFGRTYPSHLQRWRSQSCPPYTNLLIPFSISSVSCFSFPFTLMFCSFVSLILFFVFLEFQLCIFFCFKFSFLRLVVALFSGAPRLHSPLPHPSLSINPTFSHHDETIISYTMRYINCLHNCSRHCFCTVWPLKIVSIVSPETSVRKYWSTLRKIPKGHSSHLHRDGSLRSRMVRSSFTAKCPVVTVLVTWFIIKKFCILPHRVCNICCRSITIHTEMELLAGFYNGHGFCYVWGRKWILYVIFTLERATQL